MRIAPLPNRDFSAEHLEQIGRALPFEGTSIHGFDPATAVIRFGLAAVSAALLLAAFPSLAIVYDPGTELSTEDRTQYDQFGSVIAISGDFSLVGAPGHGDPGAPPFIPDMTSSGAAYVFEHREGSAVVEHVLIPADVAAQDRFGTSVAIWGNTAVVGSLYDDDVGANSGSAYVYRYDGSNWVEETKLNASDGVAHDQFGTAVAISGNTILVGSPVDNFAGDDDPGSIYVFRYDGASWIPGGRFSASDGAPQDDFGKVIALSGDVAVVGIPDADAGLGAAYVYRYDGVDSWAEEDRLSASDGAVNTSFGETFAVSGDVILVGAYRGYDNDANRVGTVYAYRYNGLDSWSQEAKLAASISAPAYNYLGHFGRSLSLSGDTAVIGAKGGILSSYAGAAHVFWYDGANWVEQDTLTASDANFGRAVAISGVTVLAGFSSTGVDLFRNIPDIKLIADDGAPSDDFGRAVALSGSTALVGAPDDDDAGNSSGSAYLFSYDGANWFDEAKLIAADGAPSERFGRSVALDGDTAVVGAPGDEGAPGAAYVFRYNGSSWGAGVKLTAADGAADDQLGRSVAVSGDVVVVGATDANGYTGAAYVFRYNGATWAQTKLTASNGAATDEFGTSVAVLGDTIVIGAPAPERTNPGQAYVFRYAGGSWSQDPPLTASDGVAGTGFGSSVALSTDTIVVGGSNAAYVFGDDGESSVEEIKLTGSGAGQVYGFGNAIAISDANTIVVGAEIDDSWVGAAYVYWHDGEKWMAEPKFIASDTVGWDLFGTSVSISGDLILVGAAQNDDVGAAYASTVGYVGVPVPEPSMLVLDLAALAALACVARRRS